MGSILSSLFDTSSTLSAAVTRHCIRRQGCCVKKFREELFCLVAGFHRRPGHTRALVQRTSKVDATHTLRGSGTFWGSLRPEHHPGRGVAEGRRYCHETSMNHAACKIEFRPLHCWISVPTAQIFQLTADVFGIYFKKTSKAHPASRRPRHGASTPEASSDKVGVGREDEGVSGRGVIVIASYCGKSSKIRLRKAGEPSPSSSCNFVHVSNSVQPVLHRHYRGTSTACQVSPKIVWICGMMYKKKIHSSCETDDNGRPIAWPKCLQTFFGGYFAERFRVTSLWGKNDDRSVWRTRNCAASNPRSA